MIRNLIIILLFLGLVSIAHAKGELSQKQLVRLQQAQAVLDEVSDESFDSVAKWLSNQHYPEISLQMEEAIAQAYTQLVSDQKLSKRKDKLWLYSQIKLNLAFLQFTGGEMAVTGNKDATSRLIQKTLKQYLPEEIYTHPGFKKSVE